MVQGFPCLFWKIESSGQSDWYKRDLKIALKKFYRWFKGCEMDPPEIAWIKTSMKNSNHKLPEELLTQEDVKRGG